MKISELKDKEGNVNIDLVIIWDNAQPEERFGRKIKSVIVKDIDSKKDDNSPSAYLDLYDSDVEKFTTGATIRVIDAYAKLIQGKTQFRLTNALRIDKLVLPPEPKSEEKTEVDTKKENKLLEEWIIRNYGPRCKDYTPTCANCKAWECYTKLKYDEE